VTATPLSAGDSAGITGGDLEAVLLPAAALAPHPANPREDLGDLTELQASIAELGLLEPLVVVTTAAHQAGGWPAPGPGPTHVILAGHRRHAAGTGAGLAKFACVVRDDLAGDDALAVMLSENDPAKRHGLTPLAEARAFAALRDRGWSQRKIAQRMGCKQPHVSKRLALLRLPAEAAGALAAGKITAADAAELARLDGHPDRAVQALREIGTTSWLTAAAVVTRHLQQLERAATAAATKAALAADGIKVVDPGALGPYGFAKRLDPSKSVIKAHRAAGCLAGAASSSDGRPEYYCRNPDTHEGTPDALPGWRDWHNSGGGQDAKRTAEDRERARAARARRQAAAELAARPVSAAQAADLVSRALISRGVDAACLKTAVGWLRAAGIGPAEGDAYSYADQVTGGGDPAEVRRLAAAMALAADESATGAEYGGPWAGRQAAYIDRLIAEVGYQPTGWEARRLKEARARAGARDRLSCPACGCRASQPCPGSYPRCDAEPGPGGTWRYRCASHPATAASASTHAGDVGDVEDVDGDEVYDALEDLLIATDPSTAAGTRLDGTAAEAIEDSRRRFSELYAGQPGNQDPGPLLAAARELLAAASPHEDTWTPELRDACARLGRLSPAGEA
jgi:ParB/RepB/Spo0J family partition protein